MIFSRTRWCWAVPAARLQSLLLPTTTAAAAAHLHRRYTGQYTRLLALQTHHVQGQAQGCVSVGPESDPGTGPEPGLISDPKGKSRVGTGADPVVGPTRDPGVDPLTVLRAGSSSKFNGRFNDRLNYGNQGQRFRCKSRGGSRGKFGIQIHE